MQAFRTLFSLVGLAIATPCCSGEFDSGVPQETSPSGDLCSRACQRRVQVGCATDPETCTDTCQLARVAGYCTKELDASLACVAEADELRCGRAPNGGACDDERVALERCIDRQVIGDKPFGG